ncbi:hypothetical protein BB560_001571 [Smittium megazygosporum]|uniref:Prenyltransferase alpha-alpha toroid domain-containing protein n=1 Tax=Smittium megazygosporum TaxID=133381 RepID=A0A2T9ZHA5_9FUNG|nr:hypothetical protein BB560_001571 [Smittium megazygosporum]
MVLEGGFNGRINKLVDGCYSYWVGSVFMILHRALCLDKDSDFLFDRIALQKYILLCSQKPGEGGLCDKPGKRPDYYHTCYCLLGLSLAQNFVYADIPKGNGSGNYKGSTLDYAVCDERAVVYGSLENKVNPIHPTFNISPEKLVNWINYF